MAGTWWRSSGAIVSLESMLPDSNGVSQILECTGEIFLRKIFIVQLLNRIHVLLSLRKLGEGRRRVTCPRRVIRKVSWF